MRERTPAAEAGFMAVGNVWAEAQTYLEATANAEATATEEADPLRG
jgi:hypothetical protein